MTDLVLIAVLLGVAVVMAAWVVIIGEYTDRKADPPTLDTRGPDDR